MLVFQKLAIESFDKLQKNIEVEMIRSFNLIKVKDSLIDLDDAGLKALPLHGLISSTTIRLRICWGYN